MPILKERLWGGSGLKKKLGKTTDIENIGESWEISTVHGNVSRVREGDLKGKSLKELIALYPEEILGKSVYKRFGKEFPILIKFIDAKKDLSIQLHPNDELAKKRHDSFGKTEMWYVMDADPGAKLIVGFNRDVSKEEYVKSLQDDSLLDLLNYEEVKTGDTFFINTGKIHAIGSGVLLAEIQQTSDITYRVYDFNRRDKNGELRELHTDLALDAVEFSKKEDFKVTYPHEKNQPNTMVDCPCFKTKYLDLNKNLDVDLSDVDSFVIYMCVEGETLVSNEYGKTKLTKGETTLLPAVSKKITLKSKNVKLLQVTI